MVSIKTFTEMALSFPEAVQAPHFDLISFRVKKKIFATIHEKHNRVMIKLDPLDQSVFFFFYKTIIYPVPGAWGKGGATFVELSKVKKPMVKDALTLAWKRIAPSSVLKKFEEAKK